MGVNKMEAILPAKLLDLLVTSIILSAFIMVLLQKFKTLSFITKNWQIWLLNLLFSFGVGIPFTIYFYDLDLFSGLWVGLFTFVGATAIYDILKNQNIIKYTPTSLSDTVEISKENEIKRGDL